MRAPEILQNKAGYLRVIQLDWNTATLGKKLQDVKNPRSGPHLHVGPLESPAVNDGVARPNQRSVPAALGYFRRRYFFDGENSRGHRANSSRRAG